LQNSIGGALAHAPGDSVGAAAIIADKYVELSRLDLGGWHIGNRRANAQRGRCAAARAVRR